MSLRRTLIKRAVVQAKQNAIRAQFGLPPFAHAATPQQGCGCGALSGGGDCFSRKFEECVDVGKCNEKPEPAKSDCINKCTGHAVRECNKEDERVNALPPFFSGHERNTEFSSPFLEALFQAIAHLPLVNPGPRRSKKS